MTTQSRRVAGVLLVIFPTVVIGGVSVLTLLINEPAYAANPLRQDLWRAGHAHAGVLLLLSLIALRYVDEAHLAERTRWLIRHAFPTAAVLLPLAFFLSVLTPEATAPNPLINLAYLGALVLVAAMVTLGIGLTRTHAITSPTTRRQSATQE
jgi:Ni,Fe-hydrogenase I cytochrome b subunit